MLTKNVNIEIFQVLQRKFDEFQKDMGSQEFRVSEVCETADKLIGEQHPESDVVTGNFGVNDLRN